MAFGLGFRALGLWLRSESLAPWGVETLLKRRVRGSYLGLVIGILPFTGFAGVMQIRGQV